MRIAIPKPAKGKDADTLPEQYLLGVDIGTAGIKVAVIDTEASLIGMESCGYNILRPAPNCSEIDTFGMWSAFINCLRALFQARKINPQSVSGIGISCLCPGLTAFDNKGEVIASPIIYSDRRSVEEAEYIKQMVGEDEIFRVTANNMMAGAISCTSMLWIKNNFPDIYKRTRYFGHVNTLMAVRMTGRYAIDYSNASYTGLFETAGGFRWSEALCEKSGIDIEKLPPLLRSREVVGGLIEPEMIALGLRPDTPVVIGGGDTACASLAVGITGNGDVCESVGTTNVLTVCVDRPRFDRSFINRCHVVDGTWIYQGALSHTGASMVWFRDTFCGDLKQAAEAGGKKAFARMDEEASQSNPGAGGIVFLPYMQGERSPIWDPYARGVFFGMSLDSCRSDFIRSILEGCGYGLRQLAELAEGVTGGRIGSFVSIGGGAKSEVWAQIKADILGRDITILDMSDTAPVGAALLAGVGCRAFPDAVQASARVKKTVYRRVVHNSDPPPAYEANYKIYTQLYPRIRDLYRVKAET